MIFSKDRIPVEILFDCGEHWTSTSGERVRILMARQKLSGELVAKTRYCFSHDLEADSGRREIEDAISKVRSKLLSAEERCWALREANPRRLEPAIA